MHFFAITWFVVYENSWFGRGGSYYRGNGAGVFIYDSANGGFAVSHSFRKIGLSFILIRCFGMVGMFQMGLILECLLWVLLMVMLIMMEVFA